MKVVFFGHDRISIPFLKVLLKSDEICAIVLPTNRGEKQTLPLLKFAKDRAIRYFQPNDLNGPNFLKELKSFRADVAFVYNYSHILKKPIISLFPLGMINFHGALLPQYRGANVINWVLVNGEKETGITVHYINEGIDEGPIIKREIIKIEESDNASTLKKKLAKKVPGLLNQILIDLKENKIKSFPQKKYGIPHYWPRRKVEDGKIDFLKKPDQIVNLIKALTKPWPGAFAYYHGKKVIFEQASVYNKGIKTKAGEIVFVSNEGIIIGTKPGCIKLEKIRHAKINQKFKVKEFFV